METRERIAAYVVVGVILVLAMLIHGLTSNGDQERLEVAHCAPATFEDPRCCTTCSTS